MKQPPTREGKDAGTITKRVRLINLHKVNGDIFDITYQERKRIRKRTRVKKPVVPGELTFHRNGYTVVWEDDSMRLCPTTFRLVRQFWEASNRFLSKEDIRQDVVEDDDASETVLRVLISNARKELRKAGFPYEIVTDRGKGYWFIPQT